MTRPHREARWSISIAIVIAGVFIAGALLFSGRDGSQIAAAGSAVRESGQDFRLPEDDDHVRGDPGAPVAIIEFSDLECPFCARLHPTLERTVEENTDVKWIYRHFPLTSIHSRALGAAIASECVAKIGGNNAFWLFADMAFENQHRLGSSLYENFATEHGIELTAFRSCISDRGVASEVTKDRDEAVRAGGSGTPFSVVVTASGNFVPFSGALSYSDIQGLIERARVN